MKTTFVSVFAIAALALSGCDSPPALAPARAEQGLAITGLFPTGVDGTGAVLAPGTADPHYPLVFSADALKVAIATAQNTAWAAPGSSASWISVVANSNTTPAAGGNYVYELGFNLSGAPATASITGTWACDDGCSIKLNGTAITTSMPVYSATQVFSIPVGSNFQSGANVIDFTVGNGAGPTGLLVASISGSALCVSDSDCTTGDFCNNVGVGPFVCTAKAANGAAVPTGTCTVALGARECTSGACDTADSKCGIATGDASCTTANPAVCRSGFCSTNGTCKATATSCNADGDCTTAQFCNTATNACVGKAANGVAIPANATCTGATATSAGTSNGCISNTCGTDNVCGTPTGAGGCTTTNQTSVCRSNVCDATLNGGLGLCEICTASSQAACTGASVCNTTTDTCTACNGDNGAGTSATCPSSAAPYCPGTGAACATCGAANGTTTCAASGATHTGGICQASGACANTCAIDSSCGTGKFCNTMTSACTVDLANGTPIPMIAGHNPPLTGVCTTAAGSAVCASGVCDTDNACGYANASGTCTIGDASACRSNACSTNGTCVVAGGCNVDGDCTATPDQFCNTSSHACTAKAQNGVAIPANATCTGATPTKAGTSNGCVTGTCGADNVCGTATGAGGCSSGTVCRSGVCDTMLNGGAGFCETCTTSSQGNCTASTVCDASTDTCTACNGDDGVGTASCPPTAPYCPGGGAACATTCGTAGTTLSCTAAGATHAGTICQINGTCASACVQDSNCVAGTQFCDTGALPVAQCVGDLANGLAVPNIPSHTNPPFDGICTAAVGTAACASGVCDTDNLCGYANGHGPCANDAGACRSGSCSVNNTCKPTATGCNVDGDCTTSQFCNTASNTCVAKVANGIVIPANASCTGATATQAGTSNGCLSNTCGADNVCGTPNGAGSCTTTSQTTVCRSNVCDPTLNGGQGFCEVCTRTNQSACSGATVCNSSTDTCTACNGDNTTSATATCGSATPYCPGLGGACTTCGTTGGAITCALPGAAHAGVTCIASGACSNACVTDVNCNTATQFCDNSATPLPTCIADIANGNVIPTLGGHAPPLDGKCTPQVGTAVCASHVCDTDDRCGYANGHGPCNAGNASTFCRSMACSKNGTCVRAGGCNVDADCTTAQWCNTTTNSCADRAATGTNIPSNGTCAAGVSDRCLSGSCDSDDVCGHAIGKGPCTVATEGGTRGDCRTQICDGTTSLCAQCTGADASLCPTGSTCSGDACVLSTPVITVPADGSTVSAGATSVSGTGPAGATITVRIDGTVVGTTTVDSSGNWTLPMTVVLQPGTRVVTAVASSGTGINAGTSAPATSTITVTGESGDMAAAGDMAAPGDMGTSGPPDMAMTGGPSRPGISGGGLGCRMSTQPVRMPLGASLVMLAMLLVGLLRRRTRTA